MKCAAVFSGLEMVHPRFVKADDDTPLAKAASRRCIPPPPASDRPRCARWLARALEPRIEDTLPPDWLTQLALPELDASIRLLHQPPQHAALAELESHRHPAWQRLAFDELLAQQLLLAAARRNGAA